MAKKKKNKSGLPAINYAAQNRKARHDYAIEEKFEAGIVLSGSEVKGLRSGKGNIQDSYAAEAGGEIFLLNSYIPAYDKAGGFNHEPKRQRKLLLHKKQMNKLIGALKTKGITLIPLSIYFNAKGIAKVELAIAKGKTNYDKRQSEKKRDWDREKSRIMRDK